MLFLRLLKTRIMKIFFVLNLSILFFALQLQAQKITTQEFNLPSTTALYATGTYIYNGETKQLTPQKQTQYDFKNGYLIKEATATVIGSLKLASQIMYSYNTDNELINITESGGVISETGGLEKANASHEDLKITYIKSDNQLKAFKNGQSYKTQYFDVHGKLTQEDYYDAQSNYIFEKITFVKDGKITTHFNPKLEMILKTTEYFNKDNNILLKVVFNAKNSDYDTVTIYNYDSNGNLLTTLTNNYLNSKLKYDFEYFKDGKINALPSEAINSKPKTTSFYNYTENKLWAAQIEGELYSSSEIEVAFRAFQTSDGKNNNITNQVAFMDFLDATYQKIKNQ